MIKDDNIIRLVKQIHLLIESEINRGRKQDELTAAQRDVLAYLFSHSEEIICPTDLHKALGTSKATVSGITKRMRREGLISFEVMKGDERQKVIHLTEKSRCLEEDMHKKIILIQSILYQGFTDREADMLEYLLKKVLCNLKNEKEVSDNG